MADWNNWAWWAPAAPWAGAALFLMFALLVSATLWAGWKPRPPAGPASPPSRLRWVPALTLGAACGAVAWLFVPGDPVLRSLSGAGIAFVAGAVCYFRLGSASDALLGAAQDDAFWTQNAEGVAAHMRHIPQRDELIAYAATTIMNETQATCVRVYELDGGGFKLAASLPSKPAVPGDFALAGPLARVFALNGQMPFLHFVDAASGAAADWAHDVEGMTSAEWQAEQLCLEALSAECGVAFWRDSKLAQGFFLLGGRLLSEPVRAAQRHFAVEVAGEAGRMLDVLDGAERMATERAAGERARTQRELASLVRRRMARPDTAEVAGLEFGISMDRREHGRAGFCDAIVLPGAALGLVMAETGSNAPQAAVDMVRLQALLRSRFYAYGEDLREMLDSVERAITSYEPLDKPVRLLLGRYDARSRRFLYINAGYEPPLLLTNRSDGSETRRLTATGRPLAAEGIADWRVQEVELRRRDLLLAISPGILHGHPPQGEWSDILLMQTVLDAEPQPAPAIASRLLRSANESNGAENGSERSVIVLRPSDASSRTLVLNVSPEA